MSHDAEIDCADRVLGVCACGECQRAVVDRLDVIAVDHEVRHDRERIA